jgi:hypothetical protein
LFIHEYFLFPLKRYVSFLSPLTSEKIVFRSLVPGREEVWNHTQQERESSGMGTWQLLTGSGKHPWGNPNPAIEKRETPP